MYEERKYRSLFKAEKLEYFNVCVRETDLQIAADINLHGLALEFVKKYRLQLETYIRLQPAFLTSLEPIISLKAPATAAMGPTPAF
jgi:ApbE superfamily uncharacterized protein (UPF0280 family)